MKIYRIDYSAKTYDPFFLPPFILQGETTNEVIVYFLEKCKSNEIYEIKISEICDLTNLKNK